MEEFIETVRRASDAMARMSEAWGMLSREDDDIVQGLKQWGEGFNVSLDEIPYILWSIVEELEGK